MQHTGEHLIRKWDHSGPKRVLTLDGGGIRGVLSLQFLAKIESSLQRRSKGEIKVLSDYFDLVGGTSTGAIIASLISLGWPVAKIQEKYRRLAKTVFKPRLTGRLTAGLLAPRFSDKVLKSELEKHLSHELGSESVRTGLMIVARRVDTASPWVMHNNPNGPFYPGKAGDRWVANSKFKLWDIVLASAAAPTFFKPRQIIVGWGANRAPQVGLFADGGLTPHNNPVLQALRLVTLSGHGYGWQLGSDNLLVVSVGTGSRNLIIRGGGGFGRSGTFAVKTLIGLMDDCESEAEIMMQWLSSSRSARHIDAEMGDLSADLLGDTELVQYVRYNLRLEQEWLHNQLSIERSDKELKKLHKMDRPKSVQDLEALGSIAAEAMVDDEDLPLR